MLFGYSRVSTADQNPDHQIDALLRAGVPRGNIHLDTASGAKASRPKLDLVLQLLRRAGCARPGSVRRTGEDRPADRRPVQVPRSTVYGHLDRDKTVPRQPKKITTARP